MIIGIFDKDPKKASVRRISLKIFGGIVVVLIVWFWVQKRGEYKYNISGFVRASENGDYSIVKAFLKAEMNVEVKDNYDWTAYNWASDEIRQILRAYGGKSRREL